MMDLTRRRMMRAFRLAPVAACVVVLAAVGCKPNGAPGGGTGGGSGGGTAPVARSVPGGTPQIVFERTSHDFGSLNESATDTTTFTFKNTGSGDLQINNVTTTCGCTAASLAKRRYAPGESGSIEVAFDPTAPGQQVKYVNIMANTNPVLTKLSIRANVEAFLIFEPRILKLGVLAYNEEHKATVRVSCPDEAFAITAVTTTNSFVQTRLVPADEAGDGPGQRTIELTIPPGTPWGGLYFGLDVTARGRPSPGADLVTHTSNIRVAGQLFGKVTANPDMFRFGVAPGESFERVIKLVRPDAEAFNVLATQTLVPDLPGVTVESRQVAPHIWEIVMRGTAMNQALQANQSIQIRGEITVTTDVRDEAQIPLGVLGVVRNPPVGG